MHSEKQSVQPPYWLTLRFICIYISVCDVIVTGFSVPGTHNSVYPCVAAKLQSFHSTFTHIKHMNTNLLSCPVTLTLLTKQSSHTHTTEKTALLKIYKPMHLELVCLLPEVTGWNQIHYKALHHSVPCQGLYVDITAQLLPMEMLGSRQHGECVCLLSMLISRPPCNASVERGLLEGMRLGLKFSFPTWFPDSLKHIVSFACFPSHIWTWRSFKGS